MAKSNPRKFSNAAGGVTIVRALNILGDRKVLTSEQAAKAWNRPVVSQSVPIRYSEETLRECAEMNRHGADWRLVYILGQSLRKQRQARGLDASWWMETKENYWWATQKPKAGYYPIDFKGRWGSTSWQKQEDKIAKLGPDCERAHEAIISEAVFSIYQTYQERLLENWYHWGKNLDSYGHRVAVGGFDPARPPCLRCHPDWDSHDWLRVCVVRKFQK